MDVSKAVLITGCSSGIGRATAERLARSGWTVYASARQRRRDRRSGRGGLPPARAGRHRRGVDAGRRRPVEEAEGAVGVLVNNAGYSLSGAIETVPLDEVRRQFETNVFGLGAALSARAPRNAAAELRPDRQRQLDGRPAHVSGRRLLPRLEARRRGALGCASLRGAGLRRRRRRDPAGADPNGLRRCRGGNDRGSLGGSGRAVRRLQPGGRGDHGRRLPERDRPDARRWSGGGRARDRAGDLGPAGRTPATASPAPRGSS